MDIKQNPSQPPRYTIKKQFLDTNKYQHLLEQTQIYQNLFKTWLGQIAEYYKGPSKAPILIAATFDKNVDGFVEKLQNQIYPFVHSISDISSQHLNFVSDLIRQSASASLHRDAQKLMNSIKKLSQLSNTLENNTHQLTLSENKLTFNATSSIEFYFRSNWDKRGSGLQRYQKALKRVKEDKNSEDSLYQISEQVQSDLFQFRKKVMNFKYGYLKQGVKIARKLLNCLAEYLTIGGQMLAKINNKLKMQLLSQMRSSGISISIENDIQQLKQNYANKAQAYREILLHLQNVFEFSVNPIDSKVLFNQFKEVYVGNEEFIIEMFDVFLLFESFGVRRRLMYERMNTIIKKIQQQFKSNKMKAQILTVLTKRPSYTGLSLSPLRQSRNLRKSQSQSQGFIQEFGLESVEKSISQSLEFAMESFRQLGKLCYKVTQKSMSMRETENNMSMSYQLKEVKVKNKRPSKNQIWLWKDWREFRKVQQIRTKYDEKFISQQLKKMKKIMQNNQVQLQASCQIKGNYSSKADLRIYPEKIQIFSKKNPTINFLLPYPQISSLEPTKKQTLAIRMHGGAQLKLKDFKNINEVESKINEFMMKKDQSGAGKADIPVMPVIELTQEQVEAIKNRTTEVDNQREPMTDYVKYGQIDLKSTKIQQVYTCILSDKGSSPLNKSMSFYQYFNQKNKNINFSQTKYNQPGPYYYNAQNKQITFVNCPVFSQRQSELDHPLPPLPFIPKNCHCKSKERIYWISNKQLEYRSYVYSFGAKMMEAFYTATLYKIKQNDNGVHLEIWCKIVFTQKTALKSILLKGGIGEIENLIPELIKEIEKCMKVFARDRSRGGNGKDGDNGAQNKQQNRELIEKQENNDNNNNNNEKIQPKLNVNYYLIVIVIVTVLVNVIINFVF